MPGGTMSACSSSWDIKGARKHAFTIFGVDPPRLAALLVLYIPRSMRSPRALPDRRLGTKKGKGIFARTLSTT